MRAFDLEFNVPAYEPLSLPQATTWLTDLMQAYPEVFEAYAKTPEYADYVQRLAELQREDMQAHMIQDMAFRLWHKIHPDGLQILEAEWRRRNPPPELPDDDDE